MSVVVGYLGTSYQEEEKALVAAGLVVRRVPLEQAAFAGSWSGLSGELVLRGQRMPVADFEGIWTTTSSIGLEAVADVQTYRFGGDPEQQAQVLRGLMPHTMFFGGDAREEELVDRLLRESPTFPLFVRSEVKSAAKFVGLEGCLINEPTTVEVERVVANLRRHVGEFRKLVLKEVFEIQKSSGGVDLEYRAIGRRGAIVGFDWMAGDATPDPGDELREFANEVFSRVASCGVSGALVCDVAQKSDGAGVVVECKNLSDSTLKHAVDCVSLLAG